MHLERYLAALSPAARNSLLMDVLALVKARKWAEADIIRYAPDPNPGVQTSFVSWQGREALYGGAAGGGKSVALLIAALQYVHVPGYSALLLRRTYSDLSRAGALIPRLRGWLVKTPARYRNNTHTWVFPSGATLEFGYLQHPGDEEQYQSAEFQFIGFDELTQFNEKTYRFMFSRLRRTETLAALGVSVRMRAASNPGGLGHDWVKDRFVAPVRPLNEDVRRYFPARAKDNPKLDQEEYKLSMAELDETTRAQLEDGDWDVIDDGLIDYGSLRSCEDTSCLWKRGGVRNVRAEHYFGYDVGRSRDLGVLWVFERVGDVLVTRAIEVFEKKTFAQQRQGIEDLIAEVNVVAGRIDRGGIGMQLSEELEEKYPHIVEGINLTEHAQGKLGKLLQVSILGRTVRVPDDAEMRRDFRLVRKIETVEEIVGRDIIPAWVT